MAEELKDQTLPHGHARASFGKPVRWSIEQASIEFSIDNKTLAQRLRRANVLPAKDKKFSTAQIAGAVYGDHKLELIRGAQVDREMREIELSKMRGETILVADVKPTLDNIHRAIRRIILASKLSHAEQDAALREIASLKASDIENAKPD